MVPLSILNQNGPTVAPYVLSCRKLCFLLRHTAVALCKVKPPSLPTAQHSFWLAEKMDPCCQVFLNASQHKILRSANWIAFPPPCIARSRCTSCSSLQLHLHQQIDRWSCSSATRRLSSIELPGRTARSGC